MSVNGSARDPSWSKRSGFSVRVRGDVAVALTGELDLATRLRLGRSVEEAVRLMPERVVVDLAEVTFLDASALGVFVRARRNCRLSGGDLVLRSASATVRRVLALTDLTDLIEPEPDRDVAPDASPIAHLAPRPRLVEVAIAWEAACLTPWYGATALAFDPGMMTEAMAALLDDHESSADADGAAAIAAAVSLRPGTSPVLAVQQLWALNEVMHDFVHAGHGEQLGHGPTRRRLRVEAALAGVAARVLTELERSSLIDPLTGLLNRRAFDRDLLQALAVARRQEQALTVVMVDVEGLKATNDQLGHAAGDAVLRGIGTCLARTVRTGDNVYRIGGDEFVLLLPDLTPDDVEAVMRRTVVGAPARFTWGCAGMVRDDATDEVRAAQLLDRADQRMLERRAELRRGRNDGHDGIDPVAEPHRPEPDEEVAAGQLAAGYRARVAIDGARGVIAEGFDISIDDADTILEHVAAARGQSVLTVAESLNGRTVVGPRRPRPSGWSFPHDRDADSVGDGAAPSAQV